MESRKSKRSLRMALILGAAVAGTALVGFGGLAAWYAYTENAGNSVAAGTLSHAQTVACVSSLGTIPTSGSGQSGGWCNAAITVTAISSTWSGQNGTITVANTGSLTSTFTMQMPAAGSGSLCADLALKVTDPNTVVPDTGTVYAATALTTQMPATNLYNNAATPSLNWTGGGTAGTGSGATGDTYTVNVAPRGSFTTDSTDAGQSCTFNLLFTQAA